MKETREITTRKIEPVEIEKPFETPTVAGTYGAYRDLGTQENSFQLITYWRIIRKRFWLVIGITVLMTTLAAIYMARKPNIYQARAVVQVDLEQANPDLVTSDRRSQVMNQDPSYFNTQLQLLSSENLLRRVVKELSLDSNKEFQKLKTDESVSTWRAMLKAVGLANEAPKKTNGVDEVSVSANPSLATSEEIAEAIRLAPYVDIIKKNLGVEPIRESRATFKDTRLIEVSFRHTDPEFAAFVVNGIGEVFAKANQEKRSGTSSKTNDFLQNRIAQLQSEIKEGENRLVTLSRNAQILETGGDGKTLALSGLDILNKQLLDAENDRKNAQAEYESVNKSSESLDSKAEELAGRYTTERENSIRDLRNDVDKQIAGLEAQKKRLLEEYQPTAQEVVEIDTQIKSLQDSLKKATDGNQEDLAKFRKRISTDLLNNLKTKYLSAKAKEDKIRASFDQKFNEAQGQNQSGVSLSILKQELETKKGFLKELNDQQRGNDVIRAGTDNNIAVAEIAIPPENPVSPRRLTTVLGALFLSTLFGMGLALFLEYLDDTIRSTEEIESLLGLPALAAIPRIDSLPKRKLLLVGSGEEDESKVKNPTSELLIHNDSRSSLAEAYRQLRTSILLSTAGHAPKSLLITSSLPSEGKTTTAINTAISLAQTGAKVLIIDADMRRPRLHSIFNISNAEGLSTLLASELEDANINDAVGYDEEARLHLLPSGPVPPNPAELIGSEQMAELLKKLQGKFTHVVVDSPPIASFTDGVLIASMVDGVILVVNSGRSSRQVVRRSRQLLLDIGAKVFGVVLNNVDLRSQDNYYYYQSYYHRDNYRSDDEE